MQIIFQLFVFTRHNGHDGDDFHNGHHFRNGHNGYNGYNGDNFHNGHFPIMSINEIISIMSQLADNLPYEFSGKRGLREYNYKL